MAISTYAELKSAVADWLNRSDLTSAISNFVALAEAQINRDERLHSTAGVTRGTLSVSSQFTALPSGYLKFLSVNVDGDRDYPLEAVSLYEIDEIRASQPSGTPRAYCIVGTDLEIAPVPSTATTLEIAYQAKVPALTDVATTNWLLTSHPDIYLYATLMQSAPYLHEDERVAVWASMYDKCCNDFERAEANKRWPAPLNKRKRSIG
jgi:hypothetical protein